jgi:putative peptidoglycan lipid II flippase
MSQMLKSSGGLAAATMASRILGLFREIVYARFMGAGWVADAFVLAFMIPNLLRRLLGEGALTAAFIPVFKEKEKNEGEAEMWRSASAVVSGLVLVLSGAVLLVVLGITLALRLDGLEGKTLLMLRLLRLMFPYVVMVCVAALFMGMLNARGHFFIPALGSTLLNLVLIASVLWLAPLLGSSPQQQIYGLAVGVLAAGIVQVLFQWPQLRGEGFRYRWVSPWSHPTVRQVGSRMVPGMIGVAAYQINVLLTNGFAFWVGDQVVASFNYAVRLMELPQGVFGLSLASYLLPTLSGLAADKNYGEFRKTTRQGLGYLIFINLLAAVLLLTLAEPIVRLLFERGRFDEAATLRTARALTFLAPGLVAFSSVNILARAFYALGDIRTPMRISILCLALNLILVAVLIRPYHEAGMGGANSATGFLNMSLLLYALRKKLGRLDLSSLKGQVPSFLAAALATGVTAVLARQTWDQHFGHTTFGGKLGEVFFPMTLAASVYFLILFCLKLPYVKEMLALLPGGRRFRGG